MTKHFNYILLDWDGCLAKTLHLWLSIYKKIINEKGIYLKDREIVDRMFGLWEKGFANVGIKNSKQAYKQALTYAMVDYPNTPLYPQALDLLQYLKKDKLKIALLTSSYKAHIIPALQKHHLEDYFDVVLTKDDVTHGKPNPEIIEKALTIMKGNPKEALIMGDSYHDVQTGKNAGVTTVVYYPQENEAFYSEDDLRKEKPDYMITDLLDLKNIIDS